jgi:hypothetical protein
MIMPEPIRIAKTESGSLIKVYHDGSDWAVFTTGNVKYKELWFTINSERSSKDVVNRSLELNGLTLLEFIK